MKKSGLDKGIQAQVASVIDQLRLKIKSLQDECQQSLSIYDVLAEEIKTEIRQWIREV